MFFIFSDDEGIQTESDSIPLQPVMPTVAYHAPDTNWRGKCFYSLIVNNLSPIVDMRLCFF